MIGRTGRCDLSECRPAKEPWLDVVEGLLDFYFVQPAELQRKKNELNKKLADAGKPPPLK
jgi:hypothetical protein